jgi:ribosome-binding protein aMBF1 (putative translation factor)
MTPKTKRTFNHIFKMRRNRGLKQKQLAVLLGHRYTQMVSKYEHGTSLPPLETALLLEITLGVRLSELYVDLYQDLQLLILQRAVALPDDVRRTLRSRLLGKDDDEHSRTG